MNKELSLILVNKIKNAPYLERVSGLVQIFEKTFAVENEVAITKKIPVTSFACFQNCNTSQPQVDMIPNSKYRGLLYFEDRGINGIESVGSGMRYESVLRLVCWLNTKLIMGQTDMLLSAKVINNIISKLTGYPFNENPFTRVVVKAQGIIQDRSIFSLYDYSEKETQYLMAPFEYFAIDFKIEFVVPFTCVLDVEAIYTVDIECMNDNGIPETSEIIYFTSETEMIIAWNEERARRFGNFPVIQVWQIRDDNSPEMITVPINANAVPPDQTAFSVFTPNRPGFVVIHR